MTVAAIVLFFVLLILILQWIMNRFFPDDGGIDVSKDYVADLIQEMVDGNSEGWDWDDFTTIPIKDPYLNRIRIHCASLPEEFPPGEDDYYCSADGLEVMREYIKKLRHGVGN